MAVEKSKEVRELRNAIDEFEVTLLNSSENGLFADAVDVFKGIVTDLTSALSALTASEPDPIQARVHYANARVALDNRVKQAGLGWTVRYAYGLPWFVYLTTIFLAILVAWWRSPVFFESGTVLLVPAWAPIFGILGSVLQGIWWLWLQVSERHYRRSWIIWFLAAPVVGAILGIIVYLAFAAGFIAATKTSEIADPTLPRLLAALAGFSWRWAVASLERITKAIGGG